ncbi:hypothetical protein DVH24_013947 [Malus domestica]|uniref:Uncharacterized protein n=1 Tax=Malus domestica TaxID=3750 RepID=A0A498JJ84_MALDO|nr:hypothetical protein DVH24_013947 [Malus domestica]
MFLLSPMPKYFPPIRRRGRLLTSFYSLKKLHAKKRKIVDRRASNSRKIRLHCSRLIALCFCVDNVYEKIVNFMAPETMVVSPMLLDVNNLFGLKKQKPASIV